MAPVVLFIDTKKLYPMLPSPKAGLRISSLNADSLTNCVKQFRLGIAINRRFECSVFRVQEEAKARHQLFFPEH